MTAHYLKWTVDIMSVAKTLFFPAVVAENLHDEKVKYVVYSELTYE